MQNFIPDEEIRNDYKIAKDSFYGEALKREIPPIQLKREIGAKYGLSPKECTKSNNIINAILAYLREIRKYKHEYTLNDIHDFYDITNSNSRYDKLEPFLMLESSRFIKYLLDHIYQYLINRGVKQYTLDNIDKISLGQTYAHSAQDRFYLERYKSIKKYYDEHYGIKTETARITNKLKSDLYSTLIEETYDIRLQLEQHLEDFIYECYNTYIYGSTEFTRLHNLMNDYYDQIRNFNPTHDIHHIAGTEERKLIKYRDNLHFLLQLYTYFSEEQSKINKVTKEKRIEYSLEDFNKRFNKLIEKNILDILVSKNVEDIKVSELIKVDFGFYFEITYNDDKKLYVNFILQHDFQDTSNMDEFVKHPRLYTTNVINYSTIDYQMKVTTKPLNKKLNESFDFNLNLSVDDYEDIENNEPISSKHDIIKNEGAMKKMIDFYSEFVDLGLPSKTFWAKANIGADCGDYANDWYGTYYSWGDPTEKENFTEKTYKFTGHVVKYNRTDGIVNLLPEDDIAHKFMHLYDFNICTPTKEQCEELIKYTRISGVTNYEGIEGLNGCLFISKINNNEIFIPACGYISWYGIDKGEKGFIATATRFTDPYRCWTLEIKMGDKKEPLPSVSMNSVLYRTTGVAIRPVCKLN